MSDTLHSEVLVVGAGPVGLTLALDLARRGIACRIIEQSPAYQVGTRGRGISLRTQQIFEDLGVLDALLAFDEGMAPARIYDHTQLIGESDPAAHFPPVPLPYRPILMVSQEHTEAVLRACLESYGCQVELGTQLVSFTQDAQHVVAQVRHAGQDETIVARYLVGCDGGHSTVRKIAGISFLGETWDEEHFLLGNVSVSGLDPKFSYTWGGLENGLTLQWMRHSDTWFFSAPIVPDEHGSLPSPTLESLQRLFAERTSMPGVVFSNPRWLSVWRPNIRMVDRYRAGNIFVAGDAAHVHSAAGGQGLNTGVQDAYNLGWKMAAVLQGAPDTLLDTYQDERLPVAQGVLATTSMRHRAFQQDFTQAITTLTAGKETFADPSQLSITYRGSRLSCDLDDTIGLRAGDRAPDAICSRAQSGEPVRLFDLLRGMQFTLLVFGDVPVPLFPAIYDRALCTYVIMPPEGNGVHAGDVLIDRERQAHNAYGISGNGIVLIRPDGYIGLTGGSSRPGPLIDYLRAVIGS